VAELAAPPVDQRPCIAKLSLIRGLLGDRLRDDAAELTGVLSPQPRLALPKHPAARPQLCRLHLDMAQPPPGQTETLARLCARQVAKDLLRYDLLCTEAFSLLPSGLIHEISRAATFQHTLCDDNAGLLCQPGATKLTMGGRGGLTPTGLRALLPRVRVHPHAAGEGEGEGEGEGGCAWETWEEGLAAGGADFGSSFVGCMALASLTLCDFADEQLVELQGLLRALVHAVPTLRSLALVGCLEGADAGQELLETVAGFRSLRALTLRGLGWLQDEAVGRFLELAQPAARSSRLAAVAVRECPLTTAAAQRAVREFLRCSRAKEKREQQDAAELQAGVAASLGFCAAGHSRS
jgi:hypothetical protein